MTATWIPVAVALIALSGVLATALLTRRSSGKLAHTDELSKTVAGLVDLLEQTRIQMDRERAECDRRVARLQERLESLRVRVNDGS